MMNGHCAVDASEQVPDAFAPYVRAKSDPAKYDLDQFDESYWGNLQERIALAGSLGIYVEVDLADAWAIKDPNRECYSAWAANNNVNGFDIQCPALREAPPPRVQAWLEQIVDRIGNLDNVIFQVGNETFLCPGSGAAPVWEARVAQIVHDRASLQGFAAPLIGSNAHRDDVRGEGALEYLNDHGDLAIDIIRRGKPSGINEPNSDTTPDHWMREAWEAFSRGTYFHYWFGHEDSDATVAATFARMSVFRSFVNSVPFGEYRVLSQGVVGIAGREWMAFSRAGFVPPIDLGPDPQAFRVEWIRPQTGAVAVSSVFTGAGVQTFTTPTQGEPWALRVRLQSTPDGVWELDRFDDLDAGPLAGQNGWQGAPSATVVGGNNGNELLLDPPAGSGEAGAIAMTKTVVVQTAGRHRIGLKVRVEDPGSTTLAKLEIDNGATAGWNRLFQIYVGSHIRLNYDPSGAAVMLVPQVQSGATYDLRVDFDLDSGRFDAYVNGVLAGGGTLSQTVRRVAAIGVSGWDFPGRVFFDDIVGEPIAALPPPTVHITSPADQATVHDLIPITVDATGSLARVEFQVESIVIGIDTTAPYQFAWDSRINPMPSFWDGPHTLLVRAVSIDGREATDAITVILANTGGVPAP
jgi:hypothetical protein